MTSGTVVQGRLDHVPANCCSLCQRRGSPRSHRQQPQSDELLFLVPAPQVVSRRPLADLRGKAGAPSSEDQWDGSGCKSCGRRRCRSRNVDWRHSPDRSRMSPPPLLRWQWQRTKAVASTARFRMYSLETFLISALTPLDSELNTRERDFEHKQRWLRRWCRWGDSKVETISRLAQWRIESFGPCSYRRSDGFKLGIWNWYLSIEKNRCMSVRLFPEPGRLSKEQPPIARFVLRVSNSGPGRRPYISPVTEKLLRTSEDFVWPIDCTFHGRFVIDVEFLDLKIFPLNGGDACSIWPNEGMLQTLSNKSTLRCLSRMLEEGIHADVTINTADGMLKAHKAVLSASSPVFESMFLHDLKEKESSTIDIEDMSLESCSALLGYIYGTIQQEDFWKHRLSLLAAANKYDISDLKDCCEESLLEDINSGNVFERLQESWLYQLNRLKKGCLMYLFDFGKIYDVRDDINNFFRHADKELMVEMFQEVLSVWKPQ